MQQALSSLCVRIFMSRGANRLPSFPERMVEHTNLQRNTRKDCGGVTTSVEDPWVYVWRRIHAFISDQGSMYLLSVSKIRWRNALCFITKPQHLVPKTRDLHFRSSVIVTLWWKWLRDIFIHVGRRNHFTRKIRYWTPTGTPPRRYNASFHHEGYRALSS